MRIDEISDDRRPIRGSASVVKILIELVVICFKLPNKSIHVRLWEIIPRLNDPLCGAFRIVRLKSACGQIVERVIGRLVDAGLNDAQAARACKTVKEFAGL